MGNFLDDLKKSVDTGEFNSEAAKKILEIAKLADSKAIGKSVDEMEESIKKRLENIEIQEISHEEILEHNSEYEKLMLEIKKRDAVNQQLATLIEIEDMVKASIEDMLSFILELETKFKKEIESNDNMFIDLTQQIAKIKSKYIINN